MNIQRSAQTLEVNLRMGRKTFLCPASDIFKRLMSTYRTENLTPIVLI